MIATIDRFHFTDDASMGALRLDRLWGCWTLEDEVRVGPKVYAETAIPDGNYRVGLRMEGKLHERYAQRFSDIHEGMLWIRGRFDFEYVCIHCGNSDSDTAGCPLVGTTANPDSMTVGDSAKAYRNVYPKLAEAALAGNLELRIRTRWPE